MDMVFDDNNARVLRSVHDKLVSALEDDVVPVARIECHQGVTTAKCVGPPGEMISKFELCVVSDGVEIVVAVDQAGQTLLDEVEERVERRECRVLGIDHDLLLGASPNLGGRFSRLGCVGCAAGLRLRLAMAHCCSFRMRCRTSLSTSTALG